MQSKSLTYNRFRAYLRFKLRAKKFSKKRLIFAILFYFLCSLTLFLLPLDILTKYPYLKYFTDFMDFIPAIKLMESKTFAPELCKFYASYMFVVGFLCFCCYLRALIIHCVKNPLQLQLNTTQEAYEILTKPKKALFFLIATLVFCLWAIYATWSGVNIGFSIRRSSEEYFIYNLFDIILYATYYGIMSFFTFLLGLFIVIAHFSVIIQKRKMIFKRRNNGRREKG